MSLINLHTGDRQPSPVPVTSHSNWFSLLRQSTYLLDIWPNIRQGPCLQFERLVYHELRFVAVNVNGLYLETVFHGDILAPPHSHNSPPSDLVNKVTVGIILL